MWLRAQVAAAQSRSSTSGANVAQTNQKKLPPHIKPIFFTPCAHLLWTCAAGGVHSVATIAGSRDIAVETLQSRLNEIPVNQPIVVTVAAATAARRRADSRGCGLSPAFAIWRITAGCAGVARSLTESCCRAVHKIGSP